MDENRIFAILGIPSTKNEDTIKNAYRQRLVMVNPEDDPEGFKQLRQAYEEALAYAKQTDEEAKEIDNTPSGLFVQKADELYRTLAGRTDPLLWKGLFDEPVFLDLDEEENCRNKLIAWLMRHYYFSTPVWKMIGDRIRLEEEKDSLCEIFPRDFIEYLIRKHKQGEDFEFDQIENAEGKDIDAWIFLYSKASREESENNLEAMEETLRQADEIGITHPGMSFMKVRLLSKNQYSQQAEKIVDEILAGPHASSMNVLYQAAEYYWNTEQKEKSSLLYEKLKAGMRRHYMANRRLAQWYMEAGRFADAKVCVNILLSYPVDDEVQALVDQVNAGLVRELEDKLKENSDDKKARLDLGWCYLQGERMQDGIALMEGFEPGTEFEKDYCNLMGKTYYYAKEYEKSYPMVERWLVLLQEQLPEDENSRQDDCERMATAYSMMGQIDIDRAKAMEAGEKRENLFAHAVEQFEKAKEVHDNPGRDYSIAAALYEWGKYAECEKICEELKLQYREFAAAYVLHQQACAKLFNAGGVVGDYFALKELAPDYVQSYEYAAEVYYQIRRWEDLDKLLEEAKAAGVLNGQLKHYEFFSMVNKASLKSELQAALDFAASIEEEWNDWESEKKADLLSERARNHWRMEQHDTALELIDRAIETFDGNNVYIYIKAGILKDTRKFKEAVELYLRCKEDYDETSHFYANVGECYYKDGNYKEAMPYLEKAVEMDEHLAMSACWLCRIYKSNMERQNDLQWFEKAKPILEQMVKVRPESYFYIEKGLFCQAAEEDEMAVESFEMAVKADPEDPFAYSNLARAYKQQDRMEEAIDTAKKAVSYMEKDPSPYHLETMGKIYEHAHQYDLALDCYQQAWEKFPRQRVNYIYEFVYLLCINGKWQEALEKTEAAYANNKRAAARRTVEIYCYAQQYDAALNYVKHHYSDVGISQREIEEEFSKIYWRMGDGKKAAAHIQKALNLCPQSETVYPDLCEHAAAIQFYLGKRENAVSYACEYIEYYQRNGGIQKRINALDDRPMRIYEMGAIQLYQGNIEAAQSVVDELKQCRRCSHCRYRYCTDAWELQAGIYLAQGKIDEAIRIYEALSKESPLDMDVRMKLRMLTAKKKG